MQPIISVENLVFHYNRECCALSDINISVAKGEILSIIGSNGSGKTTLLHSIAGLVFPSSGRVLFEGNEVNEKNLFDQGFNRHFRSKVGYLFQNPDVQLFCATVMDELLFGPLQMGYTKDEALDRASSIIAMLDIESLSDRPVHMLSGGEKKRVAIGAILTTNPDVLLLDEPLNTLDPKTRSFIVELIIRLNEAGKTIIIATHHLELVNHLQCRVVVLSEQHTIVKQAMAKEILEDTQLLIDTNLISEHWHRHDTEVHRHLASGFLFHKH